MDLQITRHAHEVLAAAPPSAMVTRATAETVHDQAADPSAEVQITRHGQEALLLTPPIAAVTRTTAEVVHDQVADSAAELQVSKHGQEVAVEFPAEAGTTRMSAEVVHDQVADPAAELQVSKHGQEVLARRTLIIDASPLPAFWRFFGHNFDSTFEIETSFSTHISRSGKVAEERIRRWQRPRRTLRKQWTLQDRSKDSLQELLQQLRSSKTNEWVVPIASDGAAVDAVNMGQVSLTGDFSKRRFFTGGRVVVLQLTGAEGRVARTHSTTLASANDGLLVLNDSLPFDLAEGRGCVLPVMATLPVLQSAFQVLERDTWDATVEFREKGGTTALPGAIDGLPPNFESYRDLPILRPRHDFSNPLDIEILREGTQRELGRDMATFTEGDSDRVKHVFRMVEQRTRAWDYIRFFESRLGRALPFWMFDVDQIFEVTDLEANFIEVRKRGEFSEFQKDMQFFGFMLEDGTCYVREIVTIDELPTAWRLNVVEPLPALDFEDVCMSGRARHTRWVNDSLTEKWHHNDAVEFELRTISILSEGPVTLDP